jgi:putative membrane protein
MKIRLIELIKGTAIGIANIIPGFSGGTMAVVFGLYEKLIYAFSHFFETPIKIIKEMWVILLGVILGFGVAVFGITILLDAYPIPTILLFVGLVLGSLPKIQKRANLLSDEKAPKVALIFGVAVLVALTFIPFTGNGQSTLTTAFVIGLFFIGALGSASMVIPGVSGSLIFLVFGYYDYILELASDFMSGVLSIDFSLIGSTIGYVLIFGVGVILGIVLIAKLIEKLMITHKTIIYGFIVGLLLASPLAIIVNLYKEYPNEIDESTFGVWTIGIILAFLGTGISYYFGTKDSPEDIEALQDTL